MSLAPDTYILILCLDVNCELLRKTPNPSFHTCMPLKLYDVGDGFRFVSIVT
jgi:hypothetical protein